MNKNNISKLIQTAKTLDELETLKKGFLTECEAQRDKINVANILSSINNFGDATAIFESLIPSLLKKENGKKFINKYASTIKENKTLKTFYAYHVGLNENTTSDSKRNFITEALSIERDIKNSDYINGVKNIVKLISEAFKILGDKNVLETVKIDDKTRTINESLDYLITTEKNVKNLNQYLTHLNIVTESVNNTVNKSNFNMDITLDDVLELKGSNVMESIFDETLDKESNFTKSKNICLNMIKEQRKLSNDLEVNQKLDEMSDKLSKKTYNYETYTKDMLFMSELQEVLN